MLTCFTPCRLTVVLSALHIKQYRTVLKKESSTADTPQVSSLFLFKYFHAFVALSHPSSVLWINAFLSEMANKEEPCSVWKIRKEKKTVTTMSFWKLRRYALRNCSESVCPSKQQRWSWVLGRWGKPLVSNYAAASVLGAERWAARLCPRTL